jgi:hypothetical protein
VYIIAGILMIGALLTLVLLPGTLNVRMGATDAGIMESSSRNK